MPRCTWEMPKMRRRGCERARRRGEGEDAAWMTTQCLLPWRHIQQGRADSVKETSDSPLRLCSVKRHKQACMKRSLGGGMEGKRIGNWDGRLLTVSQRCLGIWGLVFLWHEVHYTTLSSTTGVPVVSIKQLKAPPSKAPTINALSPNFKQTNEEN